MTAGIEVEGGQERRVSSERNGKGRPAKCFLVWEELGAGKGKDFVPNVRGKGGGSRNEYTLLILQSMSCGHQQGASVKCMDNGVWNSGNV